MTVELNQIQWTVEVTEQSVAGVETNVVEIAYQGYQMALLQALTFRVDGLEDTIDEGLAGFSGNLGPLQIQIDAVEAVTDALSAGLSAETAARIAGDNAANAAIALVAPPLQAQIDAEPIARAAADAAEVVARNAAITAATGPIIAAADVLEGTVNGHTSSINSLGATQVTLNASFVTLQGEFDALSLEFAAWSADFTTVENAVAAETAVRIAADNALDARLDVLEAAGATAGGDILVDQNGNVLVEA
jgi:hypothetical protein